MRYGSTPLQRPALPAARRGADAGAGAAVGSATSVSMAPSTTISPNVAMPCWKPSPNALPTWLGRHARGIAEAGASDDEREEKAVCANAA